MKLSYNLYDILEDEDVVIKPLTLLNGMRGSFLKIDTVDDGEDGTFETISDYVDLVNRIDQYGASVWLDFMSTEEEIDFESCKIKRINKYSSEAVITLEKPIPMLFGMVGDKLIMHPVQSFVGRFEIEWFWYKGPRRQNIIANGFTVYFDIISILS